MRSKLDSRIPRLEKVVGFCEHDKFFCFYKI
jgi:hypothetical protein